MQFPKTDLGTFEGERLAAARRVRPDSGGFFQDVASLLAMAAFVGSACFVLVVAFGPGVPV